jgi:hypothetical protein
MGLFSRKISPDFIAVPAEASVAQRLAELQSRIDAALRLCDAFAAGRDPDVRDAVLEVRIALMPPLAVRGSAASRTTGRTHGERQAARAASV